MVMPETKIIIIYDEDDAPTRDAAEELFHMVAPGRILLQPFPPVGPVRACNAVFRQIDDPLIAAFSDDVKMEFRGWDGYCINAMIQNQEYKCLSMLSDNVNGRNQFLGIEYPWFFCIDRQAFQDVDFYDDRFFVYGPDTDLGMKWLMSGKLMMKAKSIIIKHFESSDRLRSENMATHFATDNLAFHAKWDHLSEELLAKYAEVKDKWGLLV
jgi:hypothetical protein